jgi:uncharacterized protein (TIGR00251 family)
MDASRRPMDLGPLAVTEKGDAVRFEVHAKPGAKKSRILGLRRAALDVAVGAPPVDGAANAELAAVLARALGVPRSSVVVVRGQSSRNKLVEVRGLTAVELRVRIAAAAAASS